MPDVWNKYICRSKLLPAVAAAVLLSLTGCRSTDAGSAAEALPAIGTDYILEPGYVTADGFDTYAEFGLTAPDDTDLSRMLDPENGLRITFPDLTAEAAGAGAVAVVKTSWDFREDGDGKANTIRAILKLTPVWTQGNASDHVSAYNIVFRLIAMEPCRGSGESETLAAGEYAVRISVPESSGPVELLTEPTVTGALVFRSGSPDDEPQESIENVSVTSIRLNAATAVIEYSIPEPAETFRFLFINLVQHTNDDDDAFYVLLDDGSKIEYFERDCSTGRAVLEADSPIDPAHVSGLHLPAQR